MKHATCMFHSHRIRQGHTLYWDLPDTIDPFKLRTNKKWIPLCFLGNRYWITIYLAQNILLQNMNINIHSEEKSKKEMSISSVCWTAESGNKDFRNWRESLNKITNCFSGFKFLKEVLDIFLCKPKVENKKFVKWNF